VKPHPVTRAAFDATELLLLGIGPRLSTMEARLSTVETRAGGLCIRWAARRSTHRIKTMLANIAARSPVSNP